MPEVPKVLTAWSNFYVITGSSAAALTGLMFVVITLVAGVERLRKQGDDGVSTFSTPTVVHFCAALLVSVILTAPWHSINHPATILALTGLFGIVYVIRIVVRMRRRTGDFAPLLEDWIWYGILPLAPYIAIVAAATLLASIPTNALFALACATIVLIFIGIRNAWDSVTFIAINHGNDA